MLQCLGDVKFNAPLSDMLHDSSVWVRVCIKVPDLQIYTKSKSMLWLIKWESNVKLSGFNSSSLIRVGVYVREAKHYQPPERACVKSLTICIYFQKARIVHIQGASN